MLEKTQRIYFNVSSNLIDSRVVQLQKGACSEHWWNTHSHGRWWIIRLQKWTFLNLCLTTARMLPLWEHFYLRNQVQILICIPWTSRKLFSSFQTYWILNLSYCRWFAQVTIMASLVRSPLASISAIDSYSVRCSATLCYVSCSNGLLRT